MPTGSGGWFCCCGGCSSKEWVLTQTDGTLSDSEWDVVSGSVEYDGTGCLRLDPGTVVICKSFNPASFWSVVSLFPCDAQVQDGQEYRVIAGYKDGSTEYYAAYVKIIHKAPPHHFEWGLLKIQGGSETTLVSYDDTMSTYPDMIRICFGAIVMQAIFESYGLCRWTAGVPKPKGGKIGFASGPSQEVWVRALTASEHLDSGKKDCPNCWCYCQDDQGRKYTLPAALTCSITLDSGPDICTCLEATKGLIPDLSCSAWVSSDPYAGVCYGNAEDCSDGFWPPSGIAYDYNIHLDCGGAYPDAFALWLEQRVPPYQVTDRLHPINFSCNPFYAEFLISDEWPVGSCGCYLSVSRQIRVVITE